MAPATALHCYLGPSTSSVGSVLTCRSKDCGFGGSLFAIRSNHYFNSEAPFDSSSKLDNSMDESAKNSDAVASAEATDDAAKLHQLRRNKQALRKIIRSRIKSAYPTNNTNTTESQTLLLTKSNQVFSRLFELPQYEHAKSIGFFLSMPSGEIQTKHAIQQIVKDGKVLYVPRVGLDFELCDMDLIRCDTSSSTATVDDAADGDADGGGVGSVANAPDGEAMFYDSWPRNKWGIPEPPLTTTNVAKPGDIDLLIVPGLAFDTNGHRLGQGKLPRRADHFCTIDFSNLTPAAVAVEDLTR